jgi:hypothetical protein
MRNRFIPAFSFNRVGALYRPTLHSAMYSIRRNIQKKRPSQGWRLGRFGGSAGQTARRICVLSGATLPPIARPTLSYRYSQIPKILTLLHSQKRVARVNSAHAGPLAHVVVRRSA